MPAAARRPRSSSPRTLVALLALVPVGLALPSATEAQDVRYRTVTTTEYAGLMGSMMQIAGEGMGPDTTTTWIKGAMRREDQADGKASWIIDLESMDMTRWDHEDESYWILNFQEFMQSADSSLAEARGEMTEEDRERMEAAEASLEPSLEVDRTGETRTLNGWEAERVIMTLTLAAAENSVSEEEMEEDPMAAMMGQSSIVMLSDLWISDDLPGYAQMREALGDEAQDFATGSGGMESLAAGLPQMAALAEELKEEMEGLEGDAVLSTVYTVMVPATATLDRDSILAMGDEPLPRGPDLSELMAQAMGNAGEDAAMDAVSDALGGLGGLLGRGRDEEEPEEIQVTSAAAPTVMMRIVTEIIDVERPSLSATDFQPPAGYRERERPGG